MWEAGRLEVHLGSSLFGSVIGVSGLMATRSEEGSTWFSLYTDRSRDDITRWVIEVAS